MGTLETTQTRGFFGTATRAIVWTFRGLMWIILHYGLWLLDRFVEYVLYPISILQFGLFTGTGLMMLLSFLNSFVLLLVYDWVSTKWVRDALGLETLKEVMGKVEQTTLYPGFPKLLVDSAKYVMYNGPLMTVVVFWGLLAVVFGIVLYPLRVVLYALRRFIIRPLWLKVPWIRPTIVFFYLSLVFDPMTCTVMMRPKGTHTMGGRDWTIFFLSVVVGNVVWGLMVWTGVETLEALMPGIWEQAEMLFQRILSRFP